MSKKKIIALIMSALVAVCVIGGTLAYFSSHDSETNKFQTTGDDSNGGSDIDIVEKFTPPTGVQPGDSTDKIVQVQNIDDYDQIIKVKFAVKFVAADTNQTIDKDGNLTISYTDKNNVKGTAKITLDELKANLTPVFATKIGENQNIYTNIKDVTAGAKWYCDTATPTLASNFYYMGKVKPDAYTTRLLSAITLSKNADWRFEGIQYQVDVIADGVQATHEAFGEVDTFKVPAGDLYDRLKDAESVYGSQDIDPDIYTFLQSQKK